MSQWTRPDTVPIPTIWATFEGKKIINGIRRKYWIQDITDEYKDEVVKYMIRQFLTDEPLSKYSCVTETNDVKHLENIWYDTLKNNLGLVCLTNDENNKPTIAAMNCTTLCSIFDEKGSPEENGQILETLMWVKNQVDPFKQFNITEYLDAMGLYVLPEYRGEGLGLELLKARKPLCEACGLKASLTLFTSVISQKLAERAGFKDIYAIDYEDLQKKNPRFRYPGIENHTKTLRFMYILYE